MMLTFNMFTFLNISRVLSHSLFVGKNNEDYNDDINAFIILNACV